MQEAEEEEGAPGGQTDVGQTALQALYTSDTAAPCYCDCEKQLESEQIELLAAMTM